ncbi:MAG: type II toxin-antitoxin system prevent-host-death family antitoxin [bacterium]|jgi:prevent-host-death family protein
MNIMAAQEIKRRGIGVVDSLIGKGPVCIVKNNRPSYVIMSENEYETLMADVAEARLAASEADLKTGRIKRGSASQLMKEIMKG